MFEAKLDLALIYFPFISFAPRNCCLLRKSVIVIIAGVLPSYIVLAPLLVALHPLFVVV